jgi:hypothetical protein
MADPEIAIFLGAGASCAEGAPTQAGLLREFFKESFANYGPANGYGERHPPLKNIKALKNRLARFFKVLFGFDPMNDNLDAVEFPTFEEALGIIDLALERDELSAFWR